MAMHGDRETHLGGHDHAHGADASRAGDWLKVAVLAGLGAYFAYTIVTGNIDNYISERFGALAYAAATLFFLLAGVGLYELLSGRSSFHERVSLFAIVVVAAPLLLGALVPSKPLGADATAGRLNVGIESRSGAVPLTSNTEEWNILDWIQTFNRTDGYNALNGQTGDVIGFVLKRAEFPEGHFMVARFILSCCTADGVSVGLPVVWENSAALKNDTWVRVQGTIQVGEFNGETLPIIRATSVDATIGRPSKPYLYP